MENKHLPQTVLDEIVTDDNRQMLKAFIPYLPFRGQQFLSVYTKASELINTLSLFSDSCKAPRQRKTRPPPKAGG